MQIKKLVLPVAGLGKRLYPLTKHTPKALIYIAGKPLLDYVLEEAQASGIKDVTLVANRRHSSQLKKYLAQAKKKFPFVFHIVIQDGLGGHGHALLLGAQKFSEPFAVRFCDDIFITDKVPALKMLIDYFAKTKASIVLAQTVSLNELYRYGVVATKPHSIKTLHKVFDFIEKPKKGETTSSLATFGAYVFTPSILEHLRRIVRHAPPLFDAFPLIVGIRQALGQREMILAWEFPGKRLDCGTLQGIKEAEEYLKKRK